MKWGRSGDRLLLFAKIFFKLCQLGCTGRAGRVTMMMRKCKGGGAVNIKYKADELEAAFEKARARCIDGHVPPVDYVLHEFTSISNDTMNNYIKWAEEMEAGKREPDPEVMRASAAIKKWQEFKTFWWVTLGVTNEKLQSMAIFNLKQPCNGGYTDKPVGAVGNVEIVINTQGVGDKAFK